MVSSSIVRSTVGIELRELKECDMKEQHLLVMTSNMVVLIAFSIDNRPLTGKHLASMQQYWVRVRYSSSTNGVTFDTTISLRLSRSLYRPLLRSSRDTDNTHKVFIVPAGPYRGLVPIFPPRFIVILLAR
jgi:hypothetical protein